jgi:hypothetical protein
LKKKGGAVIGDEAVELAEVQAGIAKMKAPRQLGWQVLVTRIEPHQIGPSVKPTTHVPDEGSVVCRKP